MVLANSHDGRPLVYNIKKMRYEFAGSRMELAEVIRADVAGEFVWRDEAQRQWVIAQVTDKAIPPEAVQVDGLSSRPAPLANGTSTLPPVRKAKRIKETRYTCAACGNIWYYGKQDQMANTGAAMQNAGKDMMCCTGCAPAALISDKKVIDPRKCPKCGSRSSRAESIVHEV